MRRVLILLCLLMLTITPTIAQSDEAETWEIIERCVGEPVEPPDDWSFEGIIFIRSDYAIHGLNSDIEAPYIIAYSNNHVYAFSGSISPDGRWFAVPIGNRATEYNFTSNTYHYTITNIVLYSTDGTRQRTFIEFESFILGTVNYDISVPPVLWLDDYTFVYPNHADLIADKIDIRTHSVIEYDEDIIPDTDISPDSSHLFILDNVQDIQSLNNNRFAFVNENQLYIGEMDTHQLTDTCLSVTGFVWSPTGELAVSDRERISIINFEDNTHYIAAYHEGNVFDWRIPEEDD